MIFSRSRTPRPSYRILVNGEGKHRIEVYNSHNCWENFDWRQYNTYEEAKSVIEQHLRRTKWSVAGVVAIVE